jgi:hypothetical protein
LRRSASVFEVLGEAAADARNFNQQDIAEFDLRGEHSRSCAHAGQEVTPVMSLFNRRQGTSKGGITVRVAPIHMANFPHS